VRSRAWFALDVDSALGHLSAVPGRDRTAAPNQRPTRNRWALPADNEEMPESIWVLREVVRGFCIVASFAHASRHHLLAERCMGSAFGVLDFLAAGGLGEGLVQT
jgi:hypothetical protein